MRPRAFLPPLGLEAEGFHAHVPFRLWGAGLSAAVPPRCGRRRQRGTGGIAITAGRIWLKIFGTPVVGADHRMDLPLSL